MFLHEAASGGDEGDGFKKCPLERMGGPARPLELLLWAETIWVGWAQGMEVGRIG